jgi:hypothetical protein
MAVFFIVFPEGLDLLSSITNRASVMPAPVTFSTARIKPASRNHVTIVNLEKEQLARLSLQAA